MSVVRKTKTDRKLSMELPKFTATEKNIIVPVSKHDIDGVARKVTDMTFQLHFLCDIPILTFHFKKAWDVEVIPVNFRLFESWPETKHLAVRLQLFDSTTNSTFSEQHILLNADDTQAVLEARSEQKKMTLRQIDAIIDLIYSDYFGFTELREATRKNSEKW